MVAFTSPAMPEDQCKQISLRSQQGLSGENILGWMVTGHGGTGGHHLRATTLCSRHVCHGLGTRPPQSCMGVDCGAPLAPKGSWSGPPTALLCRSPPSKAAGSDTPYLAEGNTISVTEKERSGGDGE